MHKFKPHASERWSKLHKVEKQWGATKPRSSSRGPTREETLAAYALQSFHEPVVINKNALRNAIVWRPITHASEPTNLQTGTVMDMFRIIDSVHDIYDRKVQLHIKAMLPARTLNNAEQREYNRLLHIRNQMVKGQKGRGEIQKRITKLETLIKSSNIYPENEFVEDIFNFTQAYGRPFRSINDKVFTASTFKQWVQYYLEMPVITTAVTLSDLKSAWKNKFIQLAQRRNMTLFDQSVSCSAVTNMGTLVNSKLSRTVAGNVIKRFNLLLATDALKTSDTLSNMNTNNVTVKQGQNYLMNDKSLENNYIVNMAQVVDPASNIRLDKAYRFAFVPLKVFEKRVTNFSKFYEMEDVNTQITCDFKIIIEIMNDHAHNTVVAELKEFISSNRKSDFLTTTLTTPKEFFKHVRVYVFPHMHTDHYAQYLSINGLCIQTKEFKKQHPHKAWGESINAWNESALFKIQDKLSGFSLEDVVGFMKKDTPKTSDVRAIKWIIRHYLDWKRMGDSFQITHLMKLSQLNNRSFNYNTLNFTKYHPYHFVSIDILAIVQAIMFNVDFVYQMNGNAFVIGNNQYNTPMSRYIVHVMQMCQRIQNNRARETQQQALQGRAANTLTRFVNNNRNNNNNNNNNNINYRHLSREELITRLTECTRKIAQ
jgi:hypothetical protein